MAFAGPPKAFASRTPAWTLEPVAGHPALKRRFAQAASLLYSQLTTLAIRIVSFSAPNPSRLLNRHRVRLHRLPRASTRPADIVVRAFLSFFLLSILFPLTHYWVASFSLLSFRSCFPVRFLFAFNIRVRIVYLNFHIFQFDSLRCMLFDFIIYHFNSFHFISYYVVCFASLSSISFIIPLILHFSSWLFLLYIISLMCTFISLFLPFVSFHFIRLHIMSSHCVLVFHFMLYRFDSFVYLLASRVVSFIRLQLPYAAEGALGPQDGGEEGGW